MMVSTSFVMSVLALGTSIVSAVPLSMANQGTINLMIESDIGDVGQAFVSIPFIPISMPMDGPLSSTIGASITGTGVTCAFFLSESCSGQNMMVVGGASVEGPLELSIRNFPPAFHRNVKCVKCF